MGSENAGTVTISEGSITETAPSGFNFLGQEVVITAPAATTTAPLRIEFRIHTSIGGTDENAIEIFKDGTGPIGACSTAGEADPDPCVESRDLVGDDIVIVVLTSSASAWNFGVVAPTPTPTATATATATATVTPTPTPTPPVVAQVQKATAGSAGDASSITATYGTAPTQGNLLVLVHHYRNPNIVTVPAGWMKAVVLVGPQTATLTIAYKIAELAEGNGVTVSVGHDARQTLTIFEYSGIDTASPLDQTAFNPCISATTSCSTGTTATTVQTDELVIAGIATNGASGGFGNTWTNGFTQQSTVASTGGGPVQQSNSSTADLIVSATGTFETTESWVTSRKAQGVIATFKAFVGPAPTPTPTATATLTPTPGPSPTFTATATPLPPVVHDASLRRIHSPFTVLGGQDPDLRSLFVQVRNDGDHTETIGVYMDAIPPGGPGDPFGCLPNGRILNTTVTLNPGNQENVTAFVGFTCADQAGAAGKTYTLIAAVDTHADDLAACGTSTLLQGCFNALADDDPDTTDNRVIRGAPRVSAP